MICRELVAAPRFDIVRPNLARGAGSGGGAYFTGIATGIATGALIGTAPTGTAGAV